MVDVKRAGRPGQEPPPPLDNDDEVDTKLGTGGQQAAPGELDSRIVLDLDTAMPAIVKAVERLNT